MMLRWVISRLTILSARVDLGIDEGVSTPRGVHQIEHVTVVQ